MVRLRAEASCDVCAAVCFGPYPLWPTIRGELPEFLASIQKNITNNKTHTHEKSTPAFSAQLIGRTGFLLSGVGRVEREQSEKKNKHEKTDIFMGRFESGTLIIHGRLIIGPPLPHAGDTPESKANMLTQFPRIASEVLFAARCQAEQHDFVIIISYPPPWPPQPTHLPSPLRPAESPGPLRRGAALFVQHLKLQLGF